ncbi:hypothetical protein BCR33DRAFT_720593 [Rhizoclosmatium globosum]|uniref:BTB domain-containing protein n=1 Tax=Rhizoclosmatium globosum TaxID=329046 RepID=A0A1Y2BV41_9FUNG|nr:hypothetical protein BCR33DRAFT_720593 [Rhizoclosmatium globosum]|eukprot:ORY38544.1 hypothetical protein BCR33DRAFT_720593 [Rhizoclosmatium globosum]
MSVASLRTLFLSDSPPPPPSQSKASSAPKPTHADALVVVGSDKVHFKAHRLILATRSDFFRAQLVSQIIVDLPFLDPDAFRIVLRFIYSAQQDDEATSTKTQDWRLVLACYQAAKYLGLEDRAAIYLKVFTSIFGHADASSSDVLVACAPAFWVMFGSSASGNQPLGWLKLATLIRILNAIPDNMESAVGRFRIVTLWVQSQPAIGLFTDAVFNKDTGFVHIPFADNSPSVSFAKSPPSLHALNTHASFSTLSLSSPPSKSRLRSTPSMYTLKSHASFSDLGYSGPTNSATFFSAPPQPLNVSNEHQVLLETLHLPCLTAQDILREIEPAQLLSPSHILTLYRLAALAPPTGPIPWSPVPTGFHGRRSTVWNSRTRWSTIGPSNSPGTITYCTPESISPGSGKVSWTVVPLHGIDGIGIGVSADLSAPEQASSSLSAPFSSGADLFERLENGVTSFFSSYSPPQESTTRRASVHDGGYSLYSDGTLRVGKIFVGRLPRGVTFSRGTKVVVTLDVEARTVSFNVGGVDCGVAFRNLPVGGGSGGVYPSVVVGEGGVVCVSPLKRTF